MKIKKWLFVPLIIFTLFLYIFSLLKTPPKEALTSDAGVYFNRAKVLNRNSQIITNFFSLKPQFIDQGYPTSLALIAHLFGTNYFIIFQIANYLFCVAAAFFIYKALEVVQPHKLINYLPFFSPVFATFSVKLYSEPFSALGLSLIIYSLIKYYFGKKVRSDYFLFAFGLIILLTTKSMFIFLLLILLIFFIRTRAFNLLSVLFLTFLILLPRIYSSLSGGRGDFNLAIQAAKINLNYSEILSCSLYYLSYPVGQKILPTYEGVCRQNNPLATMHNYQRNPYLQAVTIRNQDPTFLSLIMLDLKNPLKFTLIALSSLFNFVFFEGIYPDITLAFPLNLQPLMWLLTKAVYSLILWFLFFKSSFLLIRLHAFKLIMITLIPLLIFIFTMVFFPIEQRYIYPLIPLVYFIALLKPKAAAKLS